MEVRDFIHQEVPDCREMIKYGIPTFHYFENLIHFAAYKNHIGLYPGPEAIVAFAARLAAYPKAKGSIQLPKSDLFPHDLVQEIIVYRKLEIEKKHIPKA